MQFIENSNICKGLPQDEESKSVVTDPTWDDEVTEFSQSTVFFHSVPKLPCASQFKVVLHRLQQRKNNASHVLKPINY